MTLEDNLRTVPFSHGRAHVVILGAGASLAALPNGDANGKPIPLLDDLPAIIGPEWDTLVDQSKAPDRNFEFQYAWLKEKGSFDTELKSVEGKLSDYFSSLCLPNEPTIYDYLLLSLKAKDLIATFNWDPFLMQAHMRNREIVRLPDIRFLHGSVAYASCESHDILGTPSEKCPECGGLLGEGNLILPESNKDYTKDNFIKRDWDVVRETLKKSFHLTIFGYSGPDTDLAAKNLLLESWKNNPISDFCHAEIIDIKDEDDLSMTWEEFFPYSHDMYASTYWTSSLGKWPRRTEEWKTRASMYGWPSKDIEIPEFNNLSDMQAWFKELAEFENN